ncbi:MAG: hypothetical protein ACRDHK_00225 [Actinomycetota bacterium]
MARWEGFSQCPGCGYNFATGEGRSCSWGDCSYLLAELDVFCPWCRFTFLTMEGNAPCADPLSCEHSDEPMSHVENMRRWREGRAPASATD